MQCSNMTLSYIMEIEFQLIRMKQQNILKCQQINETSIQCSNVGQ